MYPDESETKLFIVKLSELHAHFIYLGKKADKELATAKRKLELALSTQELREKEKLSGTSMVDDVGRYENLVESIEKEIEKWQFLETHLPKIGQTDYEYSFSMSELRAFKFI